MLPAQELSNIRQLEDLNQRGGRMLTVVDLVEAGTLSVDMAASAMYALARGASVLTAARPGGAGKTTLLAALLNLLPPGVRIVTVDSPTVVEHAHRSQARGAQCYLVHEIGSGHWYGYLWGRPVADYFRLISAKRRIASCLHADTMEELTAILQGPPLSVAASDLAKVGIFAFMHVSMPGDWREGAQRRVALLECRNPFVPETVRFFWDRTRDQFVVSLPKSSKGTGDISPTEAFDDTGFPLFKLFRDFIDHLVAVDARSLVEVRHHVLGFYRDHPECWTTEP